MTTYLSSANRPTANPIADPTRVSINMDIIGGRGRNLNGNAYQDQRAVKSIVTLSWEALSWGQFTAISAQHFAATGLYLELADYGNTTKTYNIIPGAGLNLRFHNTVTGLDYDADTNYWEV